jgi:hypothetical protein
MKGTLGKNAPNAWFSGVGKMRSFLFYMSSLLRQNWVLYRTLTFKNKEKILVVAATQKDVMQQDFEAGIPSIENSFLQAANNKQQTRNNNETMAQNLTRQRGMT